MKNFGAKWLALAAMSAAVAGMGLNGCGGGDNGTGTAGTGGAGKGGTTGSAGKGGTTGTGGAAGKGGTTGTAGGSGTTGTGGSSGTTGTGGTAGGGGTGGGSGLTCPVATFDTTVEGFMLNTYAGPGNLAIVDASAPATLAFNATEGQPLPGSLKIDAPWTAYNQYVDAQHNYGTGMLKNWAGMKLHVRVKVASGGNSVPANSGVQPYVNTGSGYTYCGSYTNLMAGNGWNDYVLNLSTCASMTGAPDPSMVIAYGVAIQVGNGMTGVDAGLNTTPPTAAAIYVDSFWLEGSCGGTGGTGGGTGGTTGTGGRGGTGGAAGAAGTGGATGTGGAGGATGTGGAGGTTGTGGAGGTTGTGGRGGTGGIGGAGGTTGGIGGVGGIGGTTGGIGGVGGTTGTAGTTGSAGTGA